MNSRHLEFPEKGNVEWSQTDVLEFGFGHADIEVPARS